MHVPGLKFILENGMHKMLSSFRDNEIFRSIKILRNLQDYQLSYIYSVGCMF